MNFEKKFRYDGGSKLKLSGWDTKETCGIKEDHSAHKMLTNDIDKLRKLQDKLYASDKYSVLLIFQAMDAAGKDGTIKHVMSGVNPQGCQVSCFKSPSDEERDHDFLWRINRHLPERGRIGIFNRSYYEEVLVTKVHPEFILGEKLPGISSLDDVNKKFWESRYNQIVNYEDYLEANGYIIIKFFLHLSKDEQKARFLSRIDDESKNWKFSASDLKERAHWNEYQKAFESALQKTSTKKNPWYIIPADNKWFMRLAVSKIIVDRIGKLKLAYPELPKEQKEQLQTIREQLMSEE